MAVTLLLRRWVWLSRVGSRNRLLDKSELPDTRDLVHYGGLAGLHAPNILGIAFRFQGSPAIRWMSFPRHSGEHGIGIRPAPIGPLGVLVVDPGINDDPVCLVVSRDKAGSTNCWVEPDLGERGSLLHFRSRKQ